MSRSSSSDSLNSLALLTLLFILFMVVLLFNKFCLTSLWIPDKKSSTVTTGTTSHAVSRTVGASHSHVLYGSIATTL